MERRYRFSASAFYGCGSLASATTIDEDVFGRSCDILFEHVNA